MEQPNKEVQNQKKAAKKEKIAKEEAKAQQQQSAQTEKSKEKKVKTYMQKEKQKLPEMDLETGITYKRNIENLGAEYDPTIVEKYWYEFWEKRKFFHPDASVAAKTPQDKKYIIVLPPPNVTGILHIGHALTNAIQDGLIRRKRMQGYITEYLPGTDHAGIATQNVVEKYLWLTEKKTKDDYGREKFIEKVYEWKNQKADRILNQLRGMGASLDWDRLAFTLDNNLSKAVLEAFVRLHERGLIYRSNRLVNWSCVLKTAISDDEVEYIEIKEKTMMKVPGHDENKQYEFGTLTKFAYKIKGGAEGEEIVVATTRIETMLGDTAIAVNSKDPRYQHLVGKEVIHPFIKDRKITIITDDELVDMSFGTGAVKITPGHDPNDFNCGQKNKLEFINILTTDGRINDNGGQFKGLMRFDARYEVYNELEKLGLIRGKENNEMRLGLCYRTKDIIEPLMKPQWYVDCQDVAKRMIEVVKTKQLKIVPEEWEKVWYYWLENIRDWCISRQLWWGHRCPAYLVTIQGSGKEADYTREDDFVVARSEEEAYQKAEKKFKVDRSKITLKQDDDVLDTWFSSALFPFSPFGWPNEESIDFKGFYPNTILETGHDIIFFWVARMVMFGLLLTDKLPFTTVLLHPIVRDAYGRKISKSLGNAVDPIDIVFGCSLEKLSQKINESNIKQDDKLSALSALQKDFPDGIAECGTDALRFALMSYFVQGRSINLNVKRIESHREFCNKIWNSYKYFIAKVPKTFVYDFSTIKFENLAFINRWILSKFNKMIEVFNKAFEEFFFADATTAFHVFWLYDFCDVYVEVSKFLLSQNAEQQHQCHTILFHIMENGLKLLHPLMPFITEELYQKLPDFKGKAESIMIASYPEENKKWISAEIEQEFEATFNIIRALRSVYQSINLPNNVKPLVYGMPLVKDDKIEQLVNQNKDLICGLSKTQDIIMVKAKKEIPKSGYIQTVANKNLELQADVKDFIKVDVEIDRLKTKIVMNSEKIVDILKKQQLPNYDTLTPENIKTMHKTALENNVNESAKLHESLEFFKKFKREAESKK